jgi:hypothetical protein
MKIVRIIVLSTVGLLLVFSIAALGEEMAMSGGSHSHGNEAVVDSNGNLRVPADYRTA